jgi:hypothetical protein
MRALHWPLSWAISIQSSPSHPISVRSIWYCPHTYVMVSFLLAFPSILYMHSSFPPFVLHALPISSYLTWSLWLFLEKSTRYEAPPHAVFSNLRQFIIQTINK